MTAVYDRLLKTHFNDMMTAYEGVTSISLSRRVINVDGLEANDMLGSKSEAIVFYDLINADRPLLIVERVTTDDVSLRRAKKIVKGLQALKDYRVILCRVSSNVYDIVVVKDNIIEE